VLFRSGRIQVVLLRFARDGPPDRMKPIAGADWILGYLDGVGPWGLVQILYRSDAERDEKLQRLRKELGAEAAEMIERHVEWSAPRALSPLEHRLLVAVAEAPAAGVPELADVLGLTPRTVRARLERLEREGFVVAFPIVDRSAIEGLLLPLLIVRARGGRSAEAGRQALAALGDRALSGPPLPESSPLPFDLLVWARSLLELETLRRKVAACPAVSECHAFLPQEGDDRLDELVAALKAAAPP
jgi:DNA-binding Lrp family transcriptional regulator